LHTPRAFSARLLDTPEGRGRRSAPYPDVINTQSRRWHELAAKGLLLPEANRRLQQLMDDFWAQKKK
jgi:hypothetical protein